jgi:thiol-disulfide isomerase/thioredoxin
MLDFARRYPQHWRSQFIYTTVFGGYARVQDDKGVELAYRAWSEFDPQNPDPGASMAGYLLQRRLDLQRALTLAQHAMTLYPTSSIQTVRSRMFHTLTPRGKKAATAPLDDLVGLAMVRTGKVQEGLAFIQESVAAQPLHYPYQLHLGEALETAGDAEGAIAAYIEAATLPTQFDSEAHARLERLFSTAQRSKQELERRLLARLEERRQKVMEWYEPVLTSPQPLPAFVYRDLSGKKLRSDGLRGRPTVINVWATYCVPCIGELRALQRFSERNPQVNFVAVSLDGDLKKVRAVVEKSGLAPMRAALGDEKLRYAVGAQGIPLTLVVDRNGLVRVRHNSSLADATAMLERDLAAIGEARPTAP